MIDGLTLGLKEGTGVSAYARGIHQLLEAAGHQTHVLYGAEAAARHAVWPRPPSAHAFFQGVALGRQERLSVSVLDNFWRLASPMATDLLAQPLGLRPRPQSMPRPPTMDWREFTARLPETALAWNAPLLFERALAHFRITGRILRFNAPEEIDVYHSTMPFPLMAANRPNVCTFHDIIPLVLPGVTQVDLPRYREMCAAVLREFDVVVADSEHTRNDLIAEFGIDPGKITVTYVHTNIAATAGRASEASMRACLRRHRLASHDYLLCVGSLEPRKNLVRLIRAYGEARTRLPLVVVGKDGWMFEDIHRALQPMARNGRGKAGDKQVIRLEFMPPEDVATLIRHARALVFPSLYEGFGLPALEAMTLGCPVIASNVSSIPEVTGSAALLVDPYDSRDIGGAMDRLCEDEELRQRLVAQAAGQISQFSAQACWQRLLGAYGRAGVKV